MKKMLAILLAMVMVFSLMACGNTAAPEKEDATPAATEKDTEPAAEPEAEPEEEAEAEPEAEEEAEPEAEEEPEAEAGDKKVLRINLASEPDYLDPALNSSVDGGTLAANSFAGLYTYDENQELVPSVAAAMPEISEDGCTYVVPLKETVWSNGEALTANDFVYSWNRVIAEETAADYAYLFDVIARNDDGTLAVEATGDYELTIQLVSPCAYFNDLMAFATFYPVYQPEVEAADPDKTNPGAWAQEAGFVSNGAYVLESWAHDESMVYVKNENYWDAENTTIDELDFMLSADDTAIFAAYNDGSLDFIDTVPTDEIPSLLNNSEFYVVDQLGTYYAAFNVDSPIFEGLTPENAAKVRKAICLLIDRQFIVDTIAQTGQMPASSYIPAGMADGNGGIFKGEDTNYYDAENTGAAFEEEALALFDEAGVDPSTLSLTYLINQSSVHQKVAEAIQQDLAVVGITVTIKTEDWNVFLQTRKDGQYDFAREGWVADFNDPINMLEMFASNSGNNDPQFGGGSDGVVADWAPQNWDEYDAMIEEIRTTTDFAKRVEIMHQAEDMLMDTFAVIPIYYYNDIYMCKPNVTGIYSTVFGMKYFNHAAIE